MQQAAPAGSIPRAAAACLRTSTSTGSLWRQPAVQVLQLSGEHSPARLSAPLGLQQAS